VFKAAKEVVLADGALIHEGTIYNGQNASFQTIEGKVNQRSIWIRVEAVSTGQSPVTALTVQARGSFGADVELASQLDKEIALKLAAK
jgi:hypothetical protein